VTTFLPRPKALGYDKRRGKETMPTMTAKEIYAESVRSLPLGERLRLAALILQDLTEPSVALVELSDTWSAQDEREVAAFSLRYAEDLYPEDEELA
jgi:hypothetical protein